MRVIPTLLALCAIPLHTAHAQLRIRLLSSTVRDLAEPDFSTFPIESETQSSSASISGVNFTLSAPENSFLQGDYYKYQYTRTVSHLGERVVNQGITTDPENAGVVTLRIAGLEMGEHTLLTWHNLWSEPENEAGEPATIGVSVGGEEGDEVEPSIRVDNIWDSATSYIAFTVSSAAEGVEITYTPTGGDGLVYLNGFEIDTPALGKQISFPNPSHRDERIEVENGTVSATWRAPADVQSPSYNVYLGVNETDLASVAEGVSEASAVFEDLNTINTYYWRVDVVEGQTTYTGRVFMFRPRASGFPWS